MIWTHPDNIESGGKWVFPQYWNSQQPLWVIWYCEKVLIHHISGLSLAQIVAFYKTYNLWNFQLDTFKIKAWPIKNAKAKKKFILFRGAVAIFNIAQTIYTSAFNIVWTKPYHSTRLRLPVLCKLWTDPLKKLKFYARSCLLSRLKSEKRAEKSEKALTARFSTFQPVFWSQNFNLLQRGPEWTDWW